MNDATEVTNNEGVNLVKASSRGSVLASGNTTHCYSDVLDHAYKEIKSEKSILHYTRDIAPRRVRRGAVHLRDLAPGQHGSEKNVAMVASRW